MKNRARQKKQNSLLPVLLIGAGALLIVVVLVLQMVQGSNAAPTNAQNIPEPGIQRVSLADSKAAFDQSAAVFLDVRDAGSYQVNHIPGAVNIPIDELEARTAELDPNQWILTYCT
jgi:hypothetical protein